jgi:hypothetical protein
MEVVYADSEITPTITVDLSLSPITIPTIETDELELRLKRIVKDNEFTSQLIMYLMFGDLKTASILFDDYIEQNPKITDNISIMEGLARIIGKHHLGIENILASMDNAKEYSYQNEILDMMKWVISRKFKMGNAHNIFIKRMCRLEFSANVQTDTQSRRYFSHKSDAYDFLDPNANEQVLDLLIQHIDPNKDIEDDILREIYNYTPYLLEVMIRHGFSILKEIDGIPFPWYVMRSATRAIYDKHELDKGIAQNKALKGTSTDIPEWTTSHSQKFLSVLKNSRDFKFIPCYFTGCCDTRVMSVLCANDLFREKITLPMPDKEPFNGNYLIQTVEEYPAIVDLLTMAGSPKPNSNEWDIAAIRNPRLMQYVLKNKKPDITEVNSRYWVAAGYAAYKGNLSRAHFEVLKLLYEYNSNGFALLSIQQFAWSALHIVCNKFNLGLWLKMYRAKTIEKNIKDEEQRMKNNTFGGKLTRPSGFNNEERLNNLLDLPNEDHMWQIDILDWLYRIVQPSVDQFGRTPLMCMPIPTSSSTQYEPLFRRYADKDAKILNMTVDAYVQRLLSWRTAEYKHRLVSIDERERIINTETVQKYFPVKPINI